MACRQPADDQRDARTGQASCQDSSSQLATPPEGPRSAGGGRWYLGGVAPQSVVRIGCGPALVVTRVVVEFGSLTCQHVADITDRTRPDGVGVALAGISLPSLLRLGLALSLGLVLT
jgi:hypothetical protein